MSANRARPARTRVVGLRSSLGCTRSVDIDVDVERIPVLEHHFTRFGVDAFALTGDAPKCYLVSTRIGEREAYIAKAPRREGPIECATEYLIARIGAGLPLRVAEGRLVRLPPHLADGPNDVRFLSRQFLDRARGEQLVHGSQLAAACFDLQERELAAQLKRGTEWQFYTVDLVDEMLERAAKGVKADHVRLRGGFARMMAFDALVGAQDRHAQNWGVVQGATEERAPRFSPIFDTARGLFWNHTEEMLNSYQVEREARVRQYAEKSRPLIAFRDTHHPNHFELIAHISGKAGYREEVVKVISAFDPDRCARMLHTEFRRLLTRRRLEFIDGLLRYRHSTLLRLCRRG